MRARFLFFMPLIGATLLVTACDSEPEAQPAPADAPTAAGTGSSDPDDDAAPDRSIAEAQEAGTPLEERVATLGLLNKRNNVSIDIELKPGESRREGDVIVRLATCERTAPWEMPKQTGGFVQVLVQDRASSDWRRVFSGWLIKETPSINVVEHPIYDVWIKDCAMRFPGEEEPAPDTDPPASDSNEA